MRRDCKSTPVVADPTADTNKAGMGKCGWTHLTKQTTAAMTSEVVVEVLLQSAIQLSTLTFACDLCAHLRKVWCHGLRRSRWRPCSPTRTYQSTNFCPSSMTFLLAMNSDDNLWKHLFPNGSKHLEKLKKKYSILDKQKKLDGLEDVESMELIKCESPVLIIDTSLMDGIDCFVCGVSKGCNTDLYKTKIRKAFIKHVSLHRNFHRKGENHEHKSYYSEQGCWSTKNIPFVGRKDRSSGINVGSGFLDGEYKESVSTFGKLAHDAREDFGLFINCIYGGYGKKRKQRHGNNVIFSESKNGMITGSFSVPWHLDKLDADYGITCCQNINSICRSNSYFCIVDYKLKISLDHCNSWCFFGGKVKHGTSESSHVNRLALKNDVFYDEEKLSMDLVSNYVNVTWGQYTRAPPEVIYNRNCARLRRHEVAVQTNDARGRRLTQTTLGRVRRGRSNYLKVMRNKRRRNRDNNNSSSSRQ